MTPSVILTDFDRTLTYLYRDVSLLRELKDLVLEVYEPVQVPPAILRRLGADGYHAWHELDRWSRSNLDSHTASHINKQAEECVARFEISRVSVCPLFDGVVDALRDLHRGRRIGIVSSNSSEAVTQALRRARASRYVDYMGGREISPFLPESLKPSPSQLVAALDFFRVPPHDALYVGDDVVDGLAAGDAGMAFVGVLTGLHSTDELRESGAIAVLTDFTQLPSYLEEAAPLNVR